MSGVLYVDNIAIPKYRHVWVFHYHSNHTVESRLTGWQKVSGQQMPILPYFEDQLNEMAALESYFADDTTCFEYSDDDGDLHGYILVKIPKSHEPIKLRASISANGMFKFLFYRNLRSTDLTESKHFYMIDHTSVVYFFGLVGHSSRVVEFN